MAKASKAEPPKFANEFDECFRKIGHYMFVWACVESALNRLVTTAMRLGSTEGVVVCANIQVRDKLYIAETAIDLQQMRTDDWRKASKAIIKKARKHSEDRNRVAHNFFAPEEGKPECIRFFIRKAKGKLEYPETVWTPKMLSEKLESMYAITADIERIAKEIKPPPIGLLGGLSALGAYGSEQPPPTQRRGLLGRAFQANLQSQGDRPRLGATLLSDFQTPPDPGPLAGFWEDWAQQNPDEPAYTRSPPQEPTPKPPPRRTRGGSKARPKAAKKDAK